GSLYNDSSRFQISGLVSKRLHVTIGAALAKRLPRQLRGRIGFGRELWLASPHATIGILPGDKFSFQKKEEALLIELPPPLVEAICGKLQPVRGKYEWEQAPNFTLEVEPTHVKDQKGNVIEVIG